MLERKNYKKTVGNIHKRDLRFSHGSHKYQKNEKYHTVAEFYE
jgi:hypothetical protein